LEALTIKIHPNKIILKLDIALPWKQYFKTSSPQWVVSCFKFY